MVKNKKMSTTQVIVPKVVTPTLENVFYDLVKEFDLEIVDAKKKKYHLKNKKASGANYSLIYELIDMDENHDQILSYKLGFIEAIFRSYATTKGIGLNYCIPSNKLEEHRLDLVDMLNTTEDNEEISLRLPLGQWAIADNYRIRYRPISVEDPNQIFNFLTKHINFFQAHF